jgi:hypothetical protein
LDRADLSFIQRLREKHLDPIAFISAVAAPIGIEVAAHFERIEMRLGDIDRPARGAQLCRLRNAFTLGVEVERVSVTVMKRVS